MILRKLLHKLKIKILTRMGKRITDKIFKKLSVERSKKAKKQFFNNLKICDCGSNSAKELKKEENVQTQSKNKIK
jgi:hypothetical protein